MLQFTDFAFVHALCSNTVIIRIKTDVLLHCSIISTVHVSIHVLDLFYRNKEEKKTHMVSIQLFDFDIMEKLSD